MKSKVVLGLVVIAAATLAVVWFVIPEKYEVTVEVRVELRPELYSWMEDGSLVYGRDAPLRDLNAHALQIRSHLILGTALQQPGIEELSCLKEEKDKTQWLQDNLRVECVGESDVLRLAMTGGKPEELVEILKAVRAAYTKRVVMVERDLEVRRRMTLESAYKDLDKQIGRKKILLKDLSEQLERYEDPLAVKRIELVQNNINKMEREIAEAEIAEADRVSYQRQLESMKKAVDQRVAERNETPAKIEMVRAELDEMLPKYNRLCEQLEEWTVEACRPAPIPPPIPEPEVHRVIRWFGK